MELCEAYKNAATPEEAAMVLQRYALRFTISDATLDSLKLPRSVSDLKQDTDRMAEEHKMTPSVNHSEVLDRHTPTVITNQVRLKPEDTEKEITSQQTLASVSSSPPTPGGPVSLVTNPENTPPRSLQLEEPQPKITESPTAHQHQVISGEAKSHPKRCPPQITQQLDTTQAVRTLPSPSFMSPRPVPLFAAKPYCQPRNAQSGHKPIKVKVHPCQ